MLPWKFSVIKKINISASYLRALHLYTDKQNGTDEEEDQQSSYILIHFPKPEIEAQNWWSTHASFGIFTQDLQSSVYMTWDQGIIWLCILIP